MTTVDCNAKLTVLGVTFANVRDIINHAVKGLPKDGVYVGEDSESYPCFDYEDYATEKRRYWNFVFALSREEVEDKLKRLKAMSPIRMDYNKLNGQMSPMAYWQGDTHHKVHLID